MRTDAPRNNRKIYMRTEAPKQKSKKKRYENRCSEKPQKITI
jgi:hypothetical protein